ncbi:hypothetical protein GF357_03705 [Candidatus Dojkabacteria bacterium]|nr:hypothetical protein [Candidatus Dojkabacteria bacterium]
MGIDFEKYNSIEEIYRDIRDVKIQGATNVAIATFEGLKIYLHKEEDELEDLDNKQLVKRILEKANYLATARENEPLAKNGVKYIFSGLNEKFGMVKANRAESIIEFVRDLADEYLKLIADAKQRIIASSAQVFAVYEKLNGKRVEGIMTHCHSSTAESVIINYAGNFPDTKVVCTETRPLYQGRKTAKNLVKAGIDTSMVVDSAAEAFIIEKGSFPVEIVFIGADQITPEGDAINKIGSWGIALAAYADSDPIYVVSSLLKIDLSVPRDNIVIEMRDASEVWPEAPKGLKLVNPAFELINSRFIAGFITEFGIIHPDDVDFVAREKYSWL